MDMSITKTALNTAHYIINRTPKNGYYKEMTPYCRIKETTTGGIFVGKHFGI